LYHYPEIKKDGLFARLSVACFDFWKVSTARFRDCLKNTTGLKTTSFGTCPVELFQETSPDIPLNRTLVQKPKSVVFTLGSIFERHPDALV